MSVARAEFDEVLRQMADASKRIAHLEKGTQRQNERAVCRNIIRQTRNTVSHNKYKQIFPTCTIFDHFAASS